MSNETISIVYLVAGMSSRFGGNPKQFVKIGPNNETLIQYSVDQALQNGFNQVVFITNSNTEHLFRELFGDVYNTVPVLYIEQTYDRECRSRPWGTTDAICSLVGYITGSFILLNGDDIYGSEAIRDAYQLMENSDVNIIGGCKIINTLPETGNVNRGIIKVENNNAVHIVERLNISKINNPELWYEYGNVNLIGLQCWVLPILNDILQKFKSDNRYDPKIECLLPDNLNELIVNKDIILRFYEITTQIIGVTNPSDELIVREKIKNGFHHP